SITAKELKKSSTPLPVVLLNPIEHPTNRLDADPDFLGDGFQALASLEPVHNALVARSLLAFGPLPFFPGDGHLTGRWRRGSQISLIERGRIHEAPFPLDIILLSLESLPDHVHDFVPGQPHQEADQLLMSFELNSVGRHGEERGPHRLDKIHR